MRVTLAVEAWRPAHTGESGLAWSLACALASRGHSVQVLCAVSADGKRPGICVRELPASWPTPDEVSASITRGSVAHSSFPWVQRELLGKMGATTDPSSLNVEDVDVLVAIGVRSPHVRALLKRAQGYARTMIHLSWEDLILLRMPLVRLGCSGHGLFTHWEAVRRAAEVVVRTDVELMPLGTDGGDPAFLAGREDARPSVIYVGVKPPAVGGADSPHDHPGRQTFSLNELGDQRIDDLLNMSRLVIFGPGDAGDLPGLALLHGIPVVSSSQSSAAHLIRESGAGYVLDDLSSVLLDPERLGGPRAAWRTEVGEAYAREKLATDRWAEAFEEAVSA